MTKSRFVRLPGALALVAAVAGLAPLAAQAGPIYSIQVCKLAAAGSSLPATFSFLVSPPNTSVTVPVGQCRQVVVNAVNPNNTITITESPVTGVTVTGISVPYGTITQLDLPNRTVTVDDSMYVADPIGTVRQPGQPGTVNFTNAGVAGCVAPPSPMSTWFPFDESSGNIASNLQGGYASLINGPAHVPGEVANAIQFNGLDQYAAASGYGPNFGTGDFSIDFWVKTTASNGTIIDKRTGSPGNYLYGYAVDLVGGRIMLQLADNGAGWGYTNYVSPMVVNDGSWHLVAITVRRSNSTGITFYKDGQAASSANPLGRPGSLSNDAGLWFARNQVNGANYFAGAIDEVELFPWALPAATVSALWNAGPAGKCK